ncbi:MAG: phosphate acyltransferase PlsX [Balneolaceae bacterium]
MVIAVDAAGGDFYPNNPVLGALEAISEKPDLQILLVGDESSIRDHLSTAKADIDRIGILHASEVIAMDESPSSAVKNKQQSSIVLGLGAHKRGECQAFVSAGNTGALLAASVFILGKLNGVQRPTIAANFPTMKGPRLLLDAGANLELKPETFLQFAKMGTIYAREVLGVTDPSVGLLNVGEEPEKGTELLKEAFSELSVLSNFKGNIEGRDIFSAGVDVFLCDGYLGNVILKMGESIPAILEFAVGKTMQEMKLTSVEKQMVIQVLERSLKGFNYEHIGGVPFLGVNGVSMVGHGGSSPAAIKNMILNAAQCVEMDVNRKIVTSLTTIDAV